MDRFGSIPFDGTHPGDGRFPGPRARLPLLKNGRPRKFWRYVGVYGPHLMLCVGDAHIGPVRQRFWAVATPDGRLREKTALVGSGGLRLARGEVAVDAPGVRVRLSVEGSPGRETTSSHDGNWIWTRKQAGVSVSGLVELDGTPLQVEERGVVDESAGYHARHTRWWWSAGVGTAADGRAVAWNLVAGVHDSATGSERAVWVDGEPHEVGPVTFDPKLESVSGGGLELSCRAWSERRDETNALLLKSSYRQPFGEFAGTLGPGLELREGYGVMESHDVLW